MLIFSVIYTLILGTGFVLALIELKARGEKIINLQEGITHILECGYLENGEGGACVKSLENLLEDTKL